MALSGPIATFGAISGGTLYTPGTYAGVALNGGSGSGALADVTVGGGGTVTAVAMHNLSSTAIVDRTGKNYFVGDSLSTIYQNLGGSPISVNFSVAVSTLAPACENCFFGKIVTVPGGNFSNRYCGKNAYENTNVASHDYVPLIVPDEFWCGDGANVTTGLSFSSSVNGLPGAPGIISKGTFTCAANKDTVVTNAAVLASSQIIITPTNASAATLMGAATSLFVSAVVSGVSFKVTTANAAAAAGTETFAYEIT